MSSDCIFCRIVAGEIPSRKVYEDDELIAFHDIRPAAAVHFMIVPKMHLDSLADARPAEEGLLGRILLLAPVLAKEQGLADGFRTIINTGRGGGQEVMHLHVHVMGGGPLRPM
ncbi:MAG: histidine triad nucleotide-binding protein [Pseudomonadota bacterium]